MATVNQMMAATQTDRPVSPANRVVWTQKNADGSLSCRQASGKEFVIQASEIAMQAFVVFTMAFGHEL